MYNKYIITDEHVDVRLDKFLRKYSKLETLSEIFKIIKISIKVNGKKTKENYRFKLNDILEFKDDAMLDLERKEKYNKFNYDMENFKKMIVYQDDDIFIINKPNNMPMHKGDGHNFGLSEISKKYFSNSDVNFANRLDLKTMGLVIGTKNLKILRIINKIIKEKKIVKKYIAKVKKRDLVLNKEFYCNKKLLITNNNVIVSNDGNEAITKFKVIKIEDKNAILDIELLTGRKHQIRVHLSSLNLPIIGDEKYGNNKADKMYLKCYYLEFLNYRFELDKNF